MKNNAPFVSVIIPSYNRAQLIERAVNSVRSQTYNNLEIIVVDDASIDNTQDRIEAIKEKDSRVRYVRHAVNKGAQRARNTGIRWATGDYLAFLDSDNEWLPEKLEQQMSVFRQCPVKVGVVYCGFRRISENGDVLSEHLPEHRGNIYSVALRQWIADTSTLVARKDHILQAGQFTNNIRANQEWDLCIKLACICDFEFVHSVLVNYHMHDLPTISKDALMDAYGYTDVIEAHRAEMLLKGGQRLLAEHLFYAARRFMVAGRYDLARQMLIRSLQIKPFFFKALLHLTLSLGGQNGYRVMRSIKRKLSKDL